MRKAFESARAALGRAFGLLLALEAMPAVASEITSAVVTVNAPDCQEYTINVCATNLDSNTWYTVDYTFTVIPAAGPPVTITDSISFLSAAPTESVSVGECHSQTKPLGQMLSGQVQLADGGTATLEGSNGIDVSLEPNAAGCPAPTPVPAPAPCSSQAALSDLVNSLGAAGPSHFTVLSLGGKGAKLDLNRATVVGNAGVATSGALKESTPSAVTGNVTVGSQVDTTGVVGTHGPIVVDDGLLAQAVADAQAAAAYFAGLAPTPAVQAQFPANGQITTSLTVTGTPGLNVVNLPRFSLNNGSGSLTLTGAAGKAFVINVGGDFNLQTGNIQVSGGVGPLDVVYNVTNAKAKVAAMAPTTAVGILLALNNAINAVASSTFTGEIVGGYQKPLVLMDGTEVMNPCQ